MGRVSSHIIYSSSFCTAKVIGMATKSSFLRSPSAAGTHASAELTSFFFDDIPLGCGHCRHKQRTTISGEELAAADGLLSNEQTILWHRDQEKINAGEKSFQKVEFLEG